MTLSKGQATIGGRGLPNRHSTQPPDDPPRTILRSARVVADQEPDEELDKAAYNQPNTYDDEYQYLNLGETHARSALATSTVDLAAPELPAPSTPEEYQTHHQQHHHGQGIPTPEGHSTHHNQFRMRLGHTHPLPPMTDQRQAKSHTLTHHAQRAKQLSTAPNVVLAHHSEHETAQPQSISHSHDPQHSSITNKGTYLQLPEERPPLQKIKTPKLQTPTSITRQPSIMMSTDAILQDAATLMKLDKTTEARISILTHDPAPTEWHPLVLMTMEQIAKADTTTPFPPAFVTMFNEAYTRLQNTQPLAPQEAQTIARAILQKAETAAHPRLALARDLATTHDDDPEKALSIIWAIASSIATDPDTPDDLAATLDSMQQQAEIALDGLALQKTMANTHSMPHRDAPADDPHRTLAHTEDHIETEILRDTDSMDTLKDVAKADALLADHDATSAADPDPTHQYEDNRSSALGKADADSGADSDTDTKLHTQSAANYRPATGPTHCGICRAFLGDGKDCKWVRGPIAHNMTCDLFEASPITQNLSTTNKNSELDYQGAHQLNDDTATRTAAPIATRPDDTDEDTDATGDGPTSTSAPQVDGINHAFPMGAGLTHDDPSRYEREEIQKPPLQKAVITAPTTPSRPATSGTPIGTQAPRGTGTYLANNPHDDTTVESDKPPSTYPTPTNKAAPSPQATMLAWYPTTGQAQQLSHVGSVPPHEMHMTVIYFGTTLAPQQLDQVGEVIAHHALKHQPMNGEITAMSVFSPSPSSDNQHVLVALVDAPGLSEFRAAIIADLRTRNIHLQQTHGFIPHITLHYGTDGEALLRSSIQTRETTAISISELKLVQGNRTLRTFSLDRGIGEISPAHPDQVAQILENDEEAQHYARMFQR